MFHEYDEKQGIKANAFLQAIRDGLAGDVR
jgi:hypothetical protein